MAAENATPLNILGQDNITLSGTNFPYELEGNTFELKFNNADETTCEVVETTTDELVCLTSKFNANFDVNQQYVMSVTINGLTVDASTIQWKTKADVQASS
jgi:hypothetical protein